MKAGIGVLVASALALVAGCSSSTSPRTPGITASCTVTLSGALTGSYDCKPASTAWASSGNTGGFAFVVTSSATRPEITVAIGWAGQPVTGHYRSTDTGAIGGASVQTASSQTWAVGGGLGTYDLVFTSLGTTVTVANGKSYTASGTLNATLAAETATGASGTITLHATF